MQIQLSKFQFPELRMHASAGHKLRGYFGNIFRDHSDLLHNHFADGSAKYRYPLVQYKVIEKTPTLIGINEGAHLLTRLFLKVEELIFEGQKIPVRNKQLKNKEWSIGLSDDLFTYRFETLWMGLNQKNHSLYLQANEEEKKALLKRSLIGNILSFYKGIDYRAEQQILVQPILKAHQTQFKNRSMIAFSGQFTTNAILPPLVGLGKAVSRGYGAIDELQSQLI